jgi:hypothetical protein
MKCKAIALILLLTIMVRGLSSAQEQTSGRAANEPLYRYSLAGIGGAIQKTSFLSPLYYSGIDVSFLYGRVINRELYSTSVSRSINIAYLMEQNEKEKISMSYNYIKGACFNVPSGGLEILPKVSIGPAYWFDFGYTLKANNQNNPLYYKFNNMLGAMLTLQKRVGRVMLYNEFTMPLLGYYSGSEYGFSFPLFLVEDDAKFMDAFHLGAFGINKQFVNRLNVDFKYTLFRQSRSARVQYEISYQNFNLNNNNLHSAFHSIRLGFLFNQTIKPYFHE